MWGTNQHLAPRIDHDRVPVRPATFLGAAPRSPLRGRQDEALLLDRPRSQQHLPVRATGHLRERRRHADDLRAERHQPAVELGEPDVVADREPDAPQVGVVRDELLSRGEERGLAQRWLAGQVDIEQVDLAIARDDLAVAIEQA